MKFYSLFLGWKKRAAELRSDVWIMIHALRHPDTPWFARVFMALVIAYVLSPIDLIPDFIPVVGYLDDLALIPLGLILLRKMIPAHVWVECKNNQHVAPIPRSLYFLGVALIITMWLASIYLLFLWLG